MARLSGFLIRLRSDWAGWLRQDIDGDLICGDFAVGARDLVYDPVFLCVGPCYIHQELHRDYDRRTARDLVRLGLAKANGE